LLGALLGAAVAVVVTVGVAAFTKRELRLRDVLISAAGGAIGGAVITATLGVGGVTAASTARSLTAFGAGGAVAAGSEQAGHNALDDRPLHAGVAEASLIGGAVGIALPVAGRGLGKAWQAGVKRLRKPPNATIAGSEVATSAEAASAPLNAGSNSASDDSTRGITQLLDGKRSRGARRTAGRVYATVHPRAPTWLRTRFAATVEHVRAGRHGPKADPGDVERFLHETYEHVNEVNALIKALGGRPRPIPTRVAPGTRLTGVHDFGERASLRRVDALIADLERNPPTGKDGLPLRVPEWLREIPRRARAAGETTVDVGKSAPEVAAGLGRGGSPDPFAIRLHNLSAHHQRLPSTGRTSNVLIEEVADALNAMRQARIYRPEPLPFSTIRTIFDDLVAKGKLPDEALPLIRRAIRAQQRLEHSGAVNPYHLLEAPQPAPYRGLASLDPRDLERLPWAVSGGPLAGVVDHPLGVAAGTSR